MVARVPSAFEPFAALSQHMNRVWESVLEDLPQRGFSPAFPPVNLWEEREAVFVEAELPGIPQEQLELTVMGNQLTIAGERRTAGPEQAGADAEGGIVWRRRERPEGRFQRTITLPFEINAEAVKATMTGGVLTVELPKAESARPRRIRVGGAEAKA